MHPTAIGRTLFMDDVDIATAETMCEYLSRSDAAVRVTQLRVLGGAAARVPADATAYAHRSKRLLVNVAAFYTTPEDRAVRAAWVTEYARTLQPNDLSGYVGFLSDEGEARVRAAYPGVTYDRLTKIKAQYDPTNLFRLNQNIRPSAKYS
jgi:FAD/FMN-containing dehydrogenase